MLPQCYQEITVSMIVWQREHILRDEPWHVVQSFASVAGRMAEGLCSCQMQFEDVVARGSRD